MLQVISGIVQQGDRHFGYRTSGVMFIFWLTLAVYGTLKIRTYILKIKDKVNMCQLIVYAND